MAQNKSENTQDLEFLMLRKSFEELSAEERSFVLQHLESQDEYESMRAMLLTIIQLNEERELIKPKAKTRKELIAKFRNKNRKKAAWWSTLIPFSPSFSAMKLLFPVAAILLIAFFVINPLMNNDTNKGRIAENLRETETKDRSANEADNLSEPATNQEDLSVENTEVEIKEQEETKDLAAIQDSDNNATVNFFNQGESSDANVDTEVLNNTGTTFSSSEKSLSAVEKVEATQFFVPDVAEESIAESESEYDRPAVSAANYKQLLSDLYTSY
jgi:hypothetical protein